MRIEGEHLCIAYYSRDEMKITGFIQAVFLTGREILSGDIGYEVRI